MTAPAEAFNSGTDLVTLAPAGAPGDELSVTWGIRALTAGSPGGLGPRSGEMVDSHLVDMPPRAPTAGGSTFDRPGRPPCPSPQLQHVVLDGFLEPAICSELIARIDRGVRPSRADSRRGRRSHRSTRTSTTTIRWCELSTRGSTS